MAAARPPAGRKGEEDGVTVVRWRQGLIRFFDRLFVPREVFLRANGQVRFLRLSARLQKCVALAGLALFGWMAYATGSYVLHGYVLEAKRGEIEQHKLAYFDLLSEVTEYHQQFVEITRNLEDNQSYLLAMLQKASGDDARLAEIERRLKHSETEKARVAVARDGLSEKLQQFQRDLLQLADRNSVIRDQVGAVQDLLVNTRSERQQVAAAREQLGQQLEATEQRLARVEREKSALEAALHSRETQLSQSEQLRASLLHVRSELRDQVADLQAQIADAAAREERLTVRIAGLETTLAEAQVRGERLARARAGLERQVAQLRDEVAVATARERDLDARIAGLEDSLAEAQARGERLARARNGLERQVAQLHDEIEAATAREQDLVARIADLNDEVEAAIARGDGLARERDELTAEVAGLNQRMLDMADAQDEVIERLRQRTELSVDAMERTLRMTGLDVDQLLADATSASSSQGGPFVPAALHARTGNETSLEVSLALLDLRLDRWSALQGLVRALPLAAPMNQYRLTSGFGVRRDPINGRKARHDGLDFAGPMRSSIFATAPGTVVFAGPNGRYGRMVEIDHGHGVRTRYAHMSKVLVKKGEKVAHRDKIGLLGSTGRSTGPHLHYEVLFKGRPQDPMKFITAGSFVYKY